ncbi:hypothetical protein B7486_71035, partial [cyanobacterium TDX16]
FELLVLVSVLWIPPVADQLGQAPPPAVLWPAILLVAPGLLLVDAAHKRLRARLSATRVERDPRDLGPEPRRALAPRPGDDLGAG